MLVVEDSPDILELWCVWLTYSGFRVEEARNGLEGIQKAHAHPPALILMDLRMPVMDGWEFKREQERDAALAGVPVIVLSALDQARAPEVSAKVRSPRMVGLVSSSPRGCRTAEYTASTPPPAISRAAQSYRSAIGVRRGSLEDA